MVQLADRCTTLEAVHSACALSQGEQSKVILVKLVPVPRLAWLGTELAGANFTTQEALEFMEYARVTSAYGIAFGVQLFQYVTWQDAIVQAAEYVGAQIVFAAVPMSRVGLWSRFQAWSLQRQLAKRDSQLYVMHHRTVTGEVMPPIVSAAPTSSSAVREI